MYRRKFLQGSLLTALAAPFIIKTPGLIMPISPPRSDDLFSRLYVKWIELLDANGNVMDTRLVPAMTAPYGRSANQDSLHTDFLFSIENKESVVFSPSYSGVASSIGFVDKYGRRVFSGGFSGRSCSAMNGDTVIFPPNALNVSLACSGGICANEH
jgi:hypothetical protein